MRIPSSAETRAACNTLAMLASQKSKSLPNTADLDYTHEVLYRAVGTLDGEGTIHARLASAHLILNRLFPWDFPRPLRGQFAKIINTSPSCHEDTADETVRSLVALFLDVSEDVINPATLGDRYEQAAWCLMEAKEGRPEPLRRLIHAYHKRNEALPAAVVAFRSQRAKGSLKVRRGRKSLHPARVMAIARMVRDRLEFQKLHNPTASLNDAARHIAAFIGRGLGTPKKAYLSVYQRIDPQSSI